MRKVNRKRRFMAFYVLVLLIVGLSVVLAAIKITNDRVIAKNNEVIENALQNIAEDEKELKFRAIFDNEFTEGYKEIKLSAQDKENINSKMLEDKSVLYMIESKEYSEDGFFRFDNGIFSDGQMLEVAYYSQNVENIGFNSLNKKIYKMFGKYIEKENVATLYENDKLLLDSNKIHNNYILKVRNLYFNSENNTYDIFIDSIFPDYLEDVEEYMKASKVEYSNDDIVHVYKLRVKNVNGSYEYLSLDICDMEQE